MPEWPRQQPLLVTSTATDNMAVAADEVPPKRRKLDNKTGKTNVFERLSGKEGDATPFPQVSLPEQPRDGASTQTLDNYAQGYWEIAETALRRYRSCMTRHRGLGHVTLQWTNIRKSKRIVRTYAI